jgi:hypothetical protein
MKDGLKKQMADKVTGLNYKTGLSMEQPTDGAEEPNATKPKVLCKFCQSSTHKTRRSKNCHYFGWPNELVDAEMVRLNILRATTVPVGLATTKEFTSQVQSDGTYFFFNLMRH